jgi:hypothetical protein
MANPLKQLYLIFLKLKVLCILIVIMALLSNIFWLRKSLSTEEHPTVEGHDNGGKKGTSSCQQRVISSSSGKTSLTGSINRSD